MHGEWQYPRPWLALAGGALLAGLYSWQVEPRWVRLESRLLPVANLPQYLEGETLIQFSDLHVVRRFNGRYQIEQMAKIQDRRPAFVVYTGDFVTYDSGRQLDELRLLLRHAPRGRLGTAAVLGNHDYGPRWQGSRIANQIVSALHDADIPVLRNNSARHAGLRLVGIDDFWGPNYRPEAIMPHLDPAEPAIVLCHNPDVADEPVWNGYRGWILAGHTHGGHIRLPFLPPPFVPVRNRRYTAGEFMLPGGRRMYINRGLGNRIPIRFNVRPEITLFTLQRRA